MSRSHPAGSLSPQDEWALLLRVFILFPALLTAIAVAGSTLLSRGPLAIDLGAAVELDPAEGARALVLGVGPSRKSSGPPGQVPAAFSVRF